MRNQNNTYFCLLLLQQQITLQNELNKFCSLITIFDSILEPLDFGNKVLAVNPNLDYVSAALADAKTTNKSLIGELREYLKLLVRLSLSSDPKN
jgi:hypothetical protein